jgi:acetate kinase
MAKESPVVLVLNPGSSTLKYAMYRHRADSGLEQLVSETMEWQLRTQGTDDDSIDTQCVDRTIASLIANQTHGEKKPGRQELGIDVVATRVVHGGSLFTKPTRVSSEMLRELEGTIHLAPLHQPPAIATMRGAMAAIPEALHVACFDTAFHATLPEVERRFAIPETQYRNGVRRYGFHGLSYESIAKSLIRISPRAADGRTVVCHLGNGASLCGMLALESRTTTMGFTPLDGLIMGTRSGRIDPGVLIHWMRQSMAPLQIETLLTKESGLLGLSGTSSDMRRIVETLGTDERSELAFDMFCRSVAKEIAGAATSLGGIDAIVFTAGIGEHCSIARSRITRYLEWIGAKIDESLNDQNLVRLHRPQSTIEILCIPTDEQKILAENGLRMLRNNPIDLKS